MALKKIKAGIKKAVKVVKAVGKGTADYSRKMKAMDKGAEMAAVKSGSRNLDIQKQAKIKRAAKKKQGVSLAKSIKNRLK